MRAELVPHPTTSKSPASRIEVDVGFDPVRPFLTYRVFGDLAQIKVPDLKEADPSLAGRKDELWRTTCFECFYGPAGSDEYIEANFALTMDWAIYRFDSYRQGMRPSSLSVEGMMGRLGPDFIELGVHLPLEGFVRPDLPAVKLRLGLSAVIEATDGSISYWALAHPSDKPDFHHPESFALPLSTPEHP